MIFGDRQQMAIEVDRFEPPWDALDAEESVWGALSIWVAGRNLCEHHRNGSDRMRADMRLPLVPLARWCRDTRTALHHEERVVFGMAFAHAELDQWSSAPPPSDDTEDDWLDQRDVWWARHFTGAATLDSLVPSVGIVRNDDRALVSWRVPTLPEADRTFVQPEGTANVSWPVVADALDEFAAAVAAWAPPECRLEAHADGADGALAYYTGLRPDEIASFPFRPAAERDPALDPLAQVVRDLTHGTATGPARESLVSHVRTAGDPAERRWLDLRGKLLPGTGTSFEQDGYDGARAARSLLDLNGRPVADIDRLLRDVDVAVSADSPLASGDRMIAAGEASGRAVAMVLDGPRTRTEWGRRFELARALGHLLLDPLRGEAIGAASGRAAIPSRRRRAGAFAAELLLPTVGLEQASDGVLDGITQGNRFARLLEDFGVGAQTAAYQLWNQDLLSSSEVRDDLIESVLGTRPAGPLRTSDPRP